MLSLSSQLSSLYAFGQLNLRAVLVQGAAPPRWSSVPCFEALSGRKPRPPPPPQWCYLNRERRSHWDRSNLNGGQYKPLVYKTHYVTLTTKEPRILTDGYLLRPLLTFASFTGLLFCEACVNGILLSTENATTLWYSSRPVCRVASK